VKIEAIVLLAAGSAFAQSSWVRLVSTDPMTDKVGVLYSVAPIGAKSTRRLSVICSDGKFAVVDYHSGVDVATEIYREMPYSKVQYRFDDLKAVDDQWYQPVEGHDLYSQQVLDGIMAAKSMKIKIVSILGDVILDEFMVSGLDTPQFRQDCGK
jgi:hypothetical protein